MVIMEYSIVFFYSLLAKNIPEKGKFWSEHVRAPSASFRHDGTTIIIPFLLEYNLTEPEYNLTEPEYNLTELEYNLTEPEYNLTEPEYNLTEPEYNLPEHMPLLKPHKGIT